jgi:hypothetical protein
MMQVDEILENRYFLPVCNIFSTLQSMICTTQLKWLCRTARSVNFDRYKKIDWS